TTLGWTAGRPRERAWPSAGWTAGRRPDAAALHAAASRTSAPSKTSYNRCAPIARRRGLDSLVFIPRVAVASLAFLRSEIPASHPSAAVLGEERMGAGVAVA